MQITVYKSHISVRTNKRYSLRVYRTERIEGEDDDWRYKWRWQHSFGLNTGMSFAFTVANHSGLNYLLSPRSQNRHPLNQRVEAGYLPSSPTSLFLDLEISHWLLVLLFSSLSSFICLGRCGSHFFLFYLFLLEQWKPNNCLFGENEKTICKCFLFFLLL